MRLLVQATPLLHNLLLEEMNAQEQQTTLLLQAQSIGSMSKQKEDVTDIDNKIK